MCVAETDLAAAQFGAGASQTFAQLAGPVFPSMDTRPSTAGPGAVCYGSAMDDERQHRGSLAAPAPGLMTGGSLDVRRQPVAADGTPRLPHVAYDEEGYPYDDGEPLGQNDHQTAQILYAAPALRTLFAERRPDAFVGCDMFIYPRRRSRGVAPDVFVAFGAGAGGGDRKSYKLFEGEPVPAFVLEVLSDSTADEDLSSKRVIYAEMGVAEYWLFDPAGESIPGRVAGHRLVGGVYRPIAPRPGGGCLSAALGVELRAEGGNLRIRDRQTGEDLLGHDEERARRTAAEGRAAAAEERAAAAEAELARLKRSYGNGPNAP